MLAVTLLVGSHGRSAAPSDASRAHRIDTEIRCPTCRGLSAADSDAPAAQAIRDEVLRRVQAGQTDGEVRAYLVSRYSADILLKPRSSGIAGLVWALPVVALVLAVGGLALAFARWRAHPGTRVSDADRALVDQALGT
ncbi:MAG: cytochrome c-type biogenesis protein CcmH [Acidimicrobiales bacterium]